MAALKPPTADAAMFAGVVGEVVDAFASSTEASPAAVAMQFLVAMGNVVGRKPHFYVGETRHGLNENLLVVGRSSHSRKGDGKNIALRVLDEVDEDWARKVTSGLSSGEGLIAAVRDRRVRKGKNGEDVVDDEGVWDKRLLVIETEFSGPLKMFAREGNILSNVMRDAWDGKLVLQTLTKKDPSRATAAHISIIGHTTPEDLRRYLSDLDAANGLGNRHLFALVDRCQLVANPERIPGDAVQSLIARARQIVNFASGVEDIKRSPEAAELWEDIYPALTADRPGLVGKLLARGPAHVTRLSALFALLARKGRIDVPHVMSAVAMWDYSVDSVEAIFRERTGDDVADRILAEMLPGQELTLSEIRQQIFSNHVSAGRLKDALELLRELGAVELGVQKTGGRDALTVRRIATAANGDEEDAGSAVGAA